MDLPLEAVLGCLTLEWPDSPTSLGSKASWAPLWARPEGFVAALTGGGGKTSLMFALARILEHKGRLVVCATTTRIRPPTAEQCAVVVLNEAVDARCVSTSLSGRVREALAHARVVTVAQGHAPGTGDDPKFLGLTGLQVDVLAAELPEVCLLVEADGAAMRPLKAAAEYEPVIPHCADVVVAMLGLDGLGVPLTADTAHRVEVVCRLLGCAVGTVVTPEMSAVLAVQGGLFRGSPVSAHKVFFYNKADNPGIRVKAEAAAREGARLAPHVTWMVGSVRAGWCARVNSL